VTDIPASHVLKVLSKYLYLAARELEELEADYLPLQEPTIDVAPDDPVATANQICRHVFVAEEDECLHGCGEKAPDGAESRTTV
jgi:hypothetical protein